MLKYVCYYYLTILWSRWATCLFDGGDELDTPDELRHEKFGEAPGAIWNAKKQCEVSYTSTLIYDINYLFLFQLVLAFPYANNLPGHI